MAKFHIVDTDLEIIDSGDNMLSLKLSCKEVNERIYDAENQCEVMSDKDYKIAKLVKYDIAQIKQSLELGDTEYITAVLSGDGFTPYYSLPDADLEVEYNEMLAMKKELNIA